jgi:hypothetical protein
MVAVAAAALVLASAIVGQARERTTLFVPAQQIIPGIPDAAVPAGGATVSCTGTPFVLIVDFENGPTSGGTCDFEHLGRPGGNLVCDDPAKLFIRPLGGEIADIPLSAFVCSVPIEEEAQPSSPAPVTQEGEQESESGEVDQSFEIS